MAEKYVSAQLPRDLDNYPIPVLSPGTPVNAAVGGASADTSLPTGAEIIEIGLTTGAYVLFSNGGTTVTSSNGQYIPAGAVVYRVPDGADTISHIQESASGRITITGLT